MQKIIIYFSDTGGGHRAAAEAIKSALDSEFGSRYKTVLVDAIVQGGWGPFALVPKLYRPTVTYTPWLWGALFHSSDAGRIAPVVNPLTKTVLNRGLKRIFQREKPDLVVSVHPLVNHPIRNALRTKTTPIPFVTVVTDLFDTHRAWYAGYPNLVIVPTEGARRRALSYGVPAEKIRVIGLPVSLKFAKESSETQKDLRVRLGLREMTTVLLVGGGEGMGRLFNIATAISDARLPLQLIVIAGRNPGLEKRLKAFEWQIPVKITGFVTNMPDWMRASDLIITKAGPGTIMESLACSLPILLSGFLPGQEQGNVTFVEESGAGELVEEPHEIVSKLKTWLAPNDTTLAQRRTRAHQLARPRTALEIAAALDEIIHQSEKQSA